MKKLVKNYEKNIKSIQNEFDNREDLILREIIVDEHKFAIFYLLGLSDTENIGLQVIDPIISYKNYKKSKIIETLTKSVLFFSEMQTESDYDNIILELLSGKAIIICDN